MKVVLLFGLLLVSAYAQTASWDLSTVSEAQNLGKSAVNQGYTARYSQSGKALKLNLAIQKEHHVRVTDSDRLLFGMDGTNSEHERAMANTTLSREAVASLCETALGKDWAKMVDLPAEELSYVEALRLAASLNEYNLLAGGSERRRGTHKGFDCICHGTPHHFPAPHGYMNAPYWGIRVLLRNTQYTNPGHAPYGNRDCILCDHNEIPQPDTADGFMYDCRFCCSGECVAGTGNETQSASYPGWDNCDYDFRYDQIRSSEDDPSFNYYLLNEVGACRVPRVYHCEEEVHRWCETCDMFLGVLTEGASDTGYPEFQECKYCDLVVGANPYICHNCSHAIDTIYNYGAGPDTAFRGESSCECEEAMWQIAHSTSQKKKNPSMYWQPHHYEGDHYEGDHYEYRPAYDYDYRPADYDYRPAYDYDYRPADYDYRPAYDYDYRPAYDYDYRPADYDYRPAYDYDYRPADYDYRPAYDYDYRPADYDYRPAYDYDYRPADYDYRPAYDYDYRPADYDYEGDHYEGNHESADYDYRPADYGYDYNYHGDGYGYNYDYSPVDYDYRPAYDYDYRPAYDYDYRAPDYDYRADYDYRPAYDYDYRPSYDYDYRPADYDYRPAYDYDYRPADYDYRPSYDYDYRPADYDYRPAYDYDYRPADYDYRPAYDYEGDHYEGDHYQSVDYSPPYDYARPIDYRPSYDYDYRPADYDYRPAYDYDYRPADYDYRPSYDYDYRPADYDYRPAYDYDYRPADYDYRPAYDYDYRPADYDYRPAYDYDYRPADYGYEGDHYEGDHYEGYHRRR